MLNTILKAITAQLQNSLFLQALLLGPAMITVCVCTHVIQLHLCHRLLSVWLKKEANLSELTTEQNAWREDGAIDARDGAKVVEEVERKQMMLMMLTMPRRRKMRRIRRMQMLIWNMTWKKTASLCLHSGQGLSWLLGRVGSPETSVTMFVSSSTWRGEYELFKDDVYLVHDMVDVHTAGVRQLPVVAVPAGVQQHTVILDSCLSKGGINFPLGQLCHLYMA